MRHLLKSIAMKKQFTLAFFSTLILVANGFSQTYCDEPQLIGGFPAHPICESAICFQDMFCCTNAWDITCASLAVTEPACANCLSDSDIDNSSLSGVVFIDYNCNGLQDPQDFGLGGVGFFNNGLPYGSSETFPNGLFEITLLPDAEYSITPEFLPGTASVTPVEITTTNQSQAFQDAVFALCPADQYYDMEVSNSTINWNDYNVWVPGSERNIVLNVNNLGPYPSSGQLVVQFPDGLVEVIEDGGGTVAVNSLTFDLNSLNPYGAAFRNFSLQLSTSAPFYEMISITAHIIADSALPADLFPQNNELVLELMVSDLNGNTPFCDFAQSNGGFPLDANCESVVCQQDPFCCNGVWDSMCAAAASSFYAECANCQYSTDATMASGRLFVDFNCDGELEGNDVPVSFEPVYRNGSIGAFSNSDGSYLMLVPQWQELTLTTNDFFGFQVNSVSLNVEDSAVSGIDFNFCPLGDVINMGVYITQPGLPPRPGFPATYQVCVENHSSQSTNGILTFNFEDMASAELLNSGSGVVNGFEITFDIADIGIFETVCFDIEFYIPPGTPPGTTLIASAEVQPQSELIPDTYQHNNLHDFISEVVAAFDPNDKTVNYPLVNHTEIPDNEGVTLEYLIRFQNTGNFFATFVRVEDVLPDLLDLNSLEMIHSSHNYEIIFHEGQHIEWFFDNIMLPDSTSDEPGSHGHIHFRINTVPGVQLDDVIENTASIFFDFKEPIITEPAITAFMDCSEGSLSIVADELTCAGLPFTLSSSRTDFEDYSWILNGQAYSGPNVEFLTNEEYVNAELTVSNAVCTLNTIQQFEIIQPPYVEFTMEGFVVCGTDIPLEISASGEVSWFLNNQLVAQGHTVLLEESGVYTIIAENECSVFEVTSPVQIVDVPDEVTISYDGEQLLVSPQGSSYMWFLNGMPFSQDGPAITPTESGEYSVIVYFGNTYCNETSDMVMITVSVEELLEAQIVIFPNPANDAVHVQLPEGNWQINVFDALGRLVAGFEEVTNDQFQIPLATIAPGTYFVQVSSEKGTAVKALVVDK
jgi:hypothetical protein